MPAPALAPIPESDGAPVLRKLPPPTLPKPAKKPSKAAPLLPPKPKKPEVLQPEDSFQVENFSTTNCSWRTSFLIGIYFIYPPIYSCSLRCGVISGTFLKLFNNCLYYPVINFLYFQDETMDGSEV